jgi:ketosteroid isomerase-like protein
MDANDPTATVERMFNAFRVGDLEALLETVHPDSTWAYYGANPHPTQVQFRGRTAVRRFFEGILKRLDMTSFNTGEPIAQGNTVVYFGSEAGTVRATGRPFKNEWTQKYVVQDAQIVEMVEYNIQVEPRG